MANLTKYSTDCANEFLMAGKYKEALKVYESLFISTGDNSFIDDGMYTAARQSKDEKLIKRTVNLGKKNGCWADPAPDFMFV
ncbi:MAG: hypothetical protein KAS32_02635 [Candidatus Peribacteraceae bacterium]|nr:hypothetical protein [Candidatus Peribacteraceae bacterium]